eukprot:scaffold166852_cov32-Tisochrysis_lutea.AAC.1
MGWVASTRGSAALTSEVASTAHTSSKSDGRKSDGEIVCADCCPSEAGSRCISSSAMTMSSVRRTHRPRSSRRCAKSSSLSTTRRARGNSGWLSNGPSGKNSRASSPPFPQLLALRAAPSTRPAAH